MEIKAQQPQAFAEINHAAIGILVAVQVPSQR